MSKLYGDSTTNVGLSLWVQWLEADLHPILIVRSVPRAESGASEVATFLINGVDHHKNDCIPVIADFVLCGEKINLNMSMG